jgi:hypothetical protein
MVTVTTRTACVFDRIQQDALFDTFAGLPEAIASMKARIRHVATNGCRVMYH